MKKIVLIVFFAFSICAYGFSQSLALADSAGPVANNSTIIWSGHPNDAEIVSYIFVKNTTSVAIAVKVKKVELNLGSGTINTFCWGLCFPPNVYVSPDPLTISAHATDSVDFAGHYTPSGFDGLSTIRYVFFNTANPSDSVCFNVSYDTYPLGVSNQTIKNSLSGAYPNPANNVVNFEYSLNVDNQGSLIIRNLLGLVVKQSDLSSSENKLSILTSDLPDGIYFYSFVVDGRTTLTRKLLVKH